MSDLQPPSAPARHHSTRAQLGLLDTLTILIASCALMLFLFWFAGQLRGEPLFQELPPWLTRAPAPLTASAGGVLSYFLWRWRQQDAGDLPTPAYPLWILGTTATLVGMLYFLTTWTPAKVAGGAPVDGEPVVENAFVEPGSVPAAGVEEPVAEPAEGPATPAGESGGSTPAPEREPEPTPESPGAVAPQPEEPDPDSEPAPSGTGTVTPLRPDLPIRDRFQRPEILVSPTPEPVLKNDDCLAINAASVRVVSGTRGFRVTDGQSTIAAAATRADADEIRKLAASHRRRCFIGRGNQRENRRAYVTQYWLGRSGVRVEPLAHADCLPYDPESLKIADGGAIGWVLTAGRSRMALFDTKADAEQGLALARQHRQQCFIGRGGGAQSRLFPPVEYWR